MLSISIYNAQSQHCQTWLTCLVKVINLNKPDSPCVEADQDQDKDYSFTQCVRVCVNQKIGCRIKYDGVLGADLRECQSPEEIGLGVSEAKTALDLMFSEATWSCSPS